MRTSSPRAAHRGGFLLVGLLVASALLVVGLAAFVALALDRWWLAAAFAALVVAVLYAVPSSARAGGERPRRAWRLRVARRTSRADASADGLAAAAQRRRHHAA